MTRQWLQSTFMYLIGLKKKFGKYRLVGNTVWIKIIRDLSITQCAIRTNPMHPLIKKPMISFFEKKKKVFELSIQTSNETWRWRDIPGHHRYHHALTTGPHNMRADIIHHTLTTKQTTGLQNMQEFLSPFSQTRFLMVWLGGIYYESLTVSNYIKSCCFLW